MKLYNHEKLDMNNSYNQNKIDIHCTLLYLRVSTILLYIPALTYLNVKQISYLYLNRPFLHTLCITRSLITVFSHPPVNDNELRFSVFVVQSLEPLI